MTGREFRDRRTELGYTQVALAERMEVSTGTIGTIESKRDEPVKEVYALALEGLAAREGEVKA